jgi:hypothetical protein
LGSAAGGGQKGKHVKKQHHTPRTTAFVKMGL